MTLVDTNVIVDVLSRDPVWFEWSAERLAERCEVGALLVNEVTYAELSVRIAIKADLQFALDELGMRLERAPASALFMAGRAFSRYRAAGGPRTSVLPDFFIAAHAEVGGLPLLTRDARRFRSYFPKVRLIAPEA
ncbi:MAG: type II toxin-antitoxin system VapC family toxin [Bauldia sp.]|nr:type II toxin-antitoxin system VapC family toxin [Bauldia sp.]